MKQLLSLLFLVLFTLKLSIAQTQLHVVGTENATDPVAKIDVNFDDGTNGVGVNGLEVALSIASANWQNGIFVRGYNGFGIKSMMYLDGIAGSFHSTNSTGLQGFSASAQSSGYGVRGENTKNGDGTGVYGIAGGSIGNNFGVKGISRSVTGTGVYGAVDATSPLGESYGVHGVANSPNGAGVYGENNKGFAVFGLGTGIGAGVKGQGYTSVGGYFISEEDNGVEAESDFEYGISATSKMKAAGYFKGSATMGISDIVLGVDGETEGTDDGVISSDLNLKSSDVHMVSNDKLIFKLDDDEGNDPEDSYFQVLNGAGDKIMTLDEDGNLEILGTYTPVSDRNAKYNIEQVEYASVLEKLEGVEIFEWKYKGQKETHMGPMAQDFFSAFNLNDDETKIATVDIDGVALASIKALYSLVIKQESELENLRSRLDLLEK